MLELEEAPLVIAAQPGPQQLVLQCPAEEIFLGGQRGGGKSYVIPLDFANRSFRFGGNFHAIAFRKSYNELEQLIRQCNAVLRPLGGRWVGGNVKTWTMPNGSTLKMRFITNLEDAQKYQGHEYQAIYGDEVGNYINLEPLDELHACLRSPHGIPTRFLLTGNPGGVCHNHLKLRYVTPAPPLTLIAEKSKITGLVSHRVFIPAALRDNPALALADPGYADRIIKATEGRPYLRKAWLEGEWNIVAGGLLDAVWTSSVHVIHPFRVPTNWKLDRSYDYGYSAPFSVAWWAESNGEEVRLANGDRRSFPSGTLFCIAEWCGVATKPSETGGGREIIPNKGIEMVATDVAKGIVAREKAMRIHGRCKPGPADSSIFDTDEGSAIADDMAKHGVEWTRAAKGKGSRVAGAEALIQRLSASLKRPMEDPGIFFYSTCRNIIRTVSAIPRDPKKRDDADTKAEDHDYDAVRYRIRAPVVHDVEEVGVIGI